MSIRFVVPVVLALVSVFTAPARPQAANLCPAIETVEIGKNRELRVNGKPFFPLGTYWGGINENDIAIYADSPFNCLMPYGSPNREELDMAQERGIRIIYSIKDYY